MFRTPHEVSIGGVYFPPLLIAALLGTVAAMLTVYGLNRYRLSRFIYHPPIVFLVLIVIYTGLIGTLRHPLFFLLGIYFMPRFPCRGSPDSPRMPRLKTH
jgi:hypothetical protein